MRLAPVRFSCFHAFPREPALCQFEQDDGLRFVDFEEHGRVDIDADEDDARVGGVAVEKIRPVMPRYSRGVEETARHASTTERREAPVVRRSAPAPSASQFSASVTDGDEWFRASAFTGTVDGSMLRTARSGPALPLLIGVWIGNLLGEGG